MTAHDKPRLVVLDNCYSLSLIQERRLEHMVTGRDLDGFFDHVWSVHPLVGASPEHDAERGVGRPTWTSVGSRHTVVEGTTARYRFRALQPLNFALAQLSLLVELQRLFRRERVSMIVAGDPIYLGLIALGLSKLHRVPMVVAVIANYDEMYQSRRVTAYPRLLPNYSVQRAIQRLVFRHADLVTVGSENNAGYAEANGAPRERIGFINLGDMIEPVHFTDPSERLSVRDELGLGTRPFSVCISRLVPDKHPEHALLAHAEARLQEPRLATVLVGDGPMRSELAAMARHRDMENEIIFAGYRDQVWISRVLSDATIVVSPLSGRALVEATLGARPIVAYDVEWQGELLTHGETGLLVPYLDHLEMAKAMCQLLADDEFADALGARARAETLERMDPVRSMEQKRRLFEKVLVPPVRAREGTTLPVVRQSLKAAVTWPPVNTPLTAAVRAALPERARNWPAFARYLPRAGVVQATLPSGQVLRMWSRGDDDIATAVYWRGWAGHEPETATPFLDLATSARVTLDIGAHVGYFSLLAALANPHGHVYGFEPLDRVRERFERNIALNGVENISCIPLALGSEEGTAEFFHVDDGIPSSSSLSGDFMRSIIDDGRLVSSQVEVTTVDRFVEKNHLAGRIDLLKVDTENTEDQVFRGMLRTLESDRPAIMCEVLKPGTGAAIEAILAPLGYRFFLLTDAGQVACDHIRHDGNWRNFFFLPGR